MPRRMTRKAHRATVALQCVRCSTTIDVGSFYWLDRNRPAHPDCLRLNVRPIVGRDGQEPTRYRFDSHDGVECKGCGFVLRADDDVVHVAAVPWHTDCRKGWGRV